MKKKLPKVAIVVGAGFLGKQVVNYLLSIDVKVVQTYYQNETGPSSIKFGFFSDDIGKIIKMYHADIIFLTAKIEFHPDKDLLKKAMERFVQACRKIRLVYLSSDGIFDGRQGMYTEDQKPQPKTEYGFGLEICEKIVTSESHNFCIARPSYIYGHSDRRLDSRLSRAIREIETMPKVERFMDMFKSPLHVNQVAEAVVKLGVSDYIGIVHTAGPKMSVFDFTKEGLEALGYPTSKLVGTLTPSDFLPDTSLDIRLMEKLTGIKPLGMKESFLAFAK